MSFGLLELLVIHQRWSSFILVLGRSSLFRCWKVVLLYLGNALETVVIHLGNSKVVPLRGWKVVLFHLEKRCKISTSVMLKVSKILKNGIELPVALTLRLPNILHIFGTCEYNYVTKTQLESCDYCFFDCCCLSYIDVFVASTLTTCKYVVACFVFPQKAYSMPFPTFG